MILFGFCCYFLKKTPLFNKNKNIHTTCSRFLHTSKNNKPMYTKGQREQERNHSFLKIVKISNHCIRAREREKQWRERRCLSMRWQRGYGGKNRRSRRFVTVVLGIVALVFLHACKRGEDLEKKKKRNKHFFSIVCENVV